jgi:hypothetical protein
VQADDKPKSGGVKVLFGTPTAPTPNSSDPRILFGGEVRMRLPCTREDLQALDAAATRNVIDKAIAIVASVNLDDRHYDDVVRFGAQLQAEHGALMEQELALTQDQALVQGQVLNTKMLSAIEAADPDVLFTSKAKGIRAALKAFGFGTSDPETVFNAHYGKITALAQDLKVLDPELSATSKKLKLLSPKFDRLITHIQAHILGANFIINYARSNFSTRHDAAHYLSQADTLESRIASLLTSRLSLEAGRVTHNLMADATHAILQAGRELVEESLPAFHTSFVAAIAHIKLSNANPDPKLLHQLRCTYINILNTLKPGEARHG